MKNLRVVQRNLLELNEQILGFCVDADNGILYIVKRRLQVLQVSTHQPGQEPETIQHDLESIERLDDIEASDIRLVEFIVESGSVFVALKKGLVIRIGVSAFSPPSCLIHEHDSEISSIRLSPDQDLIAIADEENDIQILGIDGELLYESNALSQNDSLHKPVGVGWGSKETQFFGLDGRPSKERQQNDQVTLSDAEIPVIEAIEGSEEYDQFRSRLKRNTIIDWRGDGQYLATLTFIPDVEKHSLKVWNRNLELQYMSEQLVTIERGILTWIPNGHFVCCAQRRDKIINEVAMFEKNGLVHQRISLPQNLKYLHVKDLIWSPNSKILAIVANQFVTSDDGQVHFNPVLMLYTMQNFHFYLKFTTKLMRDHYSTARWDPIHHNKLLVMSDNGSYHEYICNFEVVHSLENSTVAVVDASKVLITPTRLCAIPPPMAALNLEVANPIYALAMNHHKATNISIITTEGDIISTNSNTKDDRTCCDTLLSINQTFQGATAEIKDMVGSYQYHCSSRKINEIQEHQNFTAISDSVLIATRGLGDKGCAVVSIKTSGAASVETIVNLEHPVIAIARTPKADHNSIVLVQGNGSVDILEVKSAQMKPLFRFGQNQKLSLIELQHLVNKDQDALISLFQDMSLLFNGETCLSTSCTSFRVTENYLIYTTAENLMHFLLLDRLWAGDMTETCSQPIEVGASLIVASEADAKVILQMPRGNLEILYPRTLILSTLTHSLDSRQFLQAMQVARRHRINMNFICDYLIRLAEGSVSIIKDFALEVASHKPQLLLLFLTELDEEDTILGRYKDIIKHLPERAVSVGQKRPTLEGGKVQKVCSSIDLPHDHKYLHPRLLSLLKQTPKKTGEALWLVHKSDKHLQRESLEFMLYFIDIEQLFLDSLRTYNTDIALMVAGVSHKDPKEYLALLDEFNGEKDDLLRAFNIDMHTKHYGDAFSKLLEYHDLNQESPRAPDVRAQLREIATPKRIFKQALSCFKSTTNDVKLFEELWSDYGSYLLEKRCYLEAGIAFSKALEIRADEVDYFNKALNCFSLSDNSEKAFALVPKLTDPSQKIDPLVSRLLEENKSPEAILLYTAHRLKSAGRQDDTIDDHLTKILKKLSDKNQWYVVDLISFLLDNRSMYDSISSHVRICVESQIAAWKEESTVIHQQFDRLKELLKTYKSRLVSDQANTSSKFISDSLSTVDGSEISSTLSGSEGQVPAKTSASSIKTRNSSKSKKSQQQKKKRINLKPGGKYEDLALALELRRYILRQKSDEDEATRLAAALFEYCYTTKQPEDNYAREQVRVLNDLIAEQFELRQVICSLLWPDSPLNEQMYSLYRRYSSLLSDESRTFENEEFEVLLRPNLSKEPTRFEL